MHIHRLARDRSGATSILAALLAMIVVGFSALAIDGGYLYLQSRRLQGTADLAAIAAAQNPSQAARIAELTITGNKWPGASFTATAGTYTADRKISPKDRFAPGRTGANAVQVDVNAPGELFFGKLLLPKGAITLKRHATAAQTRWASFQVGSRLLSLNGGVANAVLSSLIGSSVNLSVADYNALARADVDLLSYVAALRTRMNVEAATFEETLSRNVDTGVALRAIGDVLKSNGNSGASSLERLASAADGRKISSLKSNIDLGPYKSAAEVSAASKTSFNVSALDLATGMIMIAGKDRQVRVDLTSGVPGVADLDVWLAVGEPPNNSPWISITDSGDVILRTAQIRLYIEAQTSGAVGNLAALRIPLYLEVASAQAKLSDIACDYSGNAEVTLSVSPSIGEIALAEISKGRLDDFKSPMPLKDANLLKTPLLKIDGKAHVRLGGEDWQSVRFSRREIDSGKVKTVSTRDTASTAISTLLGNTQLTISGLGLGVSTPNLNGGVTTILKQAGAGLDTVLDGVTGILGVGLGEADVRVGGVRCGGAALVI